MTGNRAFLIVMDSVGIGGAPDAGAYFNGARADIGANTLGHIAASRPLAIPHLAALGAGHAIELASGLCIPDLIVPPQGLWGAGTEVSRGKDTPSGHWEIAGVPVPWEWHVFPDTVPAFPEAVVQRLCALAGTAGILGNCHASGTEVIERFGTEHIRSGWPICYTSVDSVLQIAAHEQHFGLARLIRLCEDLAPMLHQMKLGRCIARPFLGDRPGQFQRTPNRRDFAISPPADTILDIAWRAGRTTHAIGKIGDIFSHRGISQLHKGKSDADLAEHLLRLVQEAESGSLIFANFVEFDTNFGHRRDVEGYALQLEWFDSVVGRMLELLGSGDLAIFTADHGNDPSWTGTDHTRERVPVLGYGAGIKPIGHVSFSDIGASLMDHLALPPPQHGTSFL